MALHLGDQVIGGPAPDPQRLLDLRQRAGVEGDIYDRSAHRDHPAAPTCER
jgi:hypothetical protein